MQPFGEKLLMMRWTQLSNNTWVLVDLPPGSNTIGCNWVFRRKYRTDGTIQTFKTRLVA